MRTETSRKVKQLLTALPFILPNILAFLAFVLGPICFSAYMSLTEYKILRPSQFIGLANYEALLHDVRFWQYLGNTAFLMLGLPLGIILSLGLATALSREIRGRVIFRTIAFLPNVCSVIALALMWKTLYNRDSGLINEALTAIGLPRVDWLFNPKMAKPSMMIISLWAGMGGTNMILYLAAMLGIDTQFYEAASIDGANGWQSFKAITWPLISPTTWFIATTGIIGGLQAGFQMAFILTGGGPLGATTTLVYYIFTVGFDWLRMGYASAIAWVLFLLIFIVTLTNLKFGERTVHYG
jgi:multiple sugar transport system permease protein